MALCLPPSPGRAALTGVYFTAVNEDLLELDADTMPFTSGGVLYVANTVFIGTDLDVRYVRNDTMGLAVLYTNKADLRFDLVNQTIYDKDGNTYSGRAVERNGYVFFPLSLVCRCFGLDWSYNRTDTIPLIRITSPSAILSDEAFLSAAAELMGARCAEYEASLAAPDDGGAAVQPQPPEIVVPPVVQAAEGQRVYLIAASKATADTRAAMELLGDIKATFLLTVEQMEDGDLVRSLVARGHSVALLAIGETEDALAEELSRARNLMWQSGCCWLELVWYGGGADIQPILDGQGFVRVDAGLDWHKKPLSSSARAEALLRAIGRYRSDIAVYLGYDGDCLEGLSHLLEGLEDADFLVSGWRVGA